MADDRTRESIDRFWQGYTPEQIQGVRGVAMDMREPYIQSTRLSWLAGEGLTTAYPTS